MQIEQWGCSPNPQQQQQQQEQERQRGQTTCFSTLAEGVCSLYEESVHTNTAGQAVKQEGSEI